MSKSKTMDIGSKMSFGSRPGRGDYSLENVKEEIRPGDQLVKIDIESLEFAPEDWNFYPPLEDEEFEKLINSILEHGLLHPIVVRKIGNRQVILSGHNRVRAYQTIYREILRVQEGGVSPYFSLENDQVNPKDYLQIMAVIKEDIADHEAQEIIIDANYVQRQLSQKLITRSVIEKYKIIREKRKQDDQGLYKDIKTRELVARDFKLSGRHIDRYRRLERLQEDLLDLFYEGAISLELASRLAGLDSEVQKYLAENHLADLARHGNKLLKDLSADMSISDLKERILDLVKPQDQISLNIRLDGQTRKILVEDEKIIKKILEILP